jgi:putative membrane protein
MRALLLRWVGTFIAVLIAAAWLPVFTQPLSWEQAAIFAAILALLNAFIRPLLVLITLPISVITLGLFILVLNALLFWLAAYLFQEIEVMGFLSALLGAVLVSVVSFIVSRFAR